MNCIKILSANKSKGDQNNERIESEVDIYRRGAGHSK